MHWGKKIWFYGVSLFVFCLSINMDANAYEVYDCWTSAKGWAEPVSEFDTNAAAVYLNVEASIYTGFMMTKWYRPDGTREEDIGTNLSARPIYESGIFVGFYTFMVIDGKEREPGQWRVEFWVQDMQRQWHQMCTCDFTVTYAPELPLYNATGKWTASTSDHWTDCPDDDPAQDGLVVIRQSGNAFTLTADEKGCSGTIDGASYTCEGSYPDDGGTVSLSMTFHLDSATYGSGTADWRWAKEDYSCQGGHRFSLSKEHPRWFPAIELLLFDRP